MPDDISQVTALQWLTPAQLAGDLDAHLLDWLFDEGSLTRRLSQLADQQFSVTPLREGWQALRADECAALGIVPGAEGWVREVYLRGHGQPWVFARSVAARSALERGGLDLQTLGTRSLGELLFCDQAFVRHPLQACQYPPAWLPADAPQQHLWARRSRFEREGLSLLVAEIFLPALWRAADKDAR
ncbi:chorismate--pyruvate lyase family protein [Pseudomonas cremoricolorata]|uniref:Probable chorismate pyruvate-lyase n=1 Tax=Pseudomonas cremoricolorata TaxID=157783 RepID=A0A089WNR6_9PSED|nr:chorismate--pyruvate lyase [Pseudomonas cremoricolorata]